MSCTEYVRFFYMYVSNYSKNPYGYVKNFGPEKHFQTIVYLPYCSFSLPRCLDLDIFGEDVEEQLVFADTMVCTGCCATLDHIVTYLFKKVTNKGGWWTAGAQSHKE